LTIFKLHCGKLTLRILHQMLEHFGTPPKWARPGAGDRSQQTAHVLAAEPARQGCLFSKTRTSRVDMTICGASPLIP
jgi:hypothetical protein